MKILIHLYLLFFFVHCSLGQVAIITDSDGYTNVRAEKSINSDVIYQVKENEVFWFDYESGDKSEWVPVFVPKNRFSNTNSIDPFIRGFMHRSRLMPLEKLPKYDGTDFKFSYVTKQFNPAEHFIDLEEGKWVKYIDGQFVWGTDGRMPRVEVVRIECEVNGAKISVHPSLYSNIYECQNNMSIYQVGDHYIVEQWNSDGAGAYQLIWVVSKRGIVQRAIGSIF